MYEPAARDAGGARMARCGRAVLAAALLGSWSGPGPAAADGENAATAPALIRLAPRIASAPRYYTVIYELNKSNLTPLMPQPLLTSEVREWWIVQTPVRSETTDNRPDGPAAARWKIDRVQAVRREMNQEQRFDSLRGSAAGTDASALRAWVGREIEILPDPAGGLRVAGVASTTRPVAPPAFAAGARFDPVSEEDFRLLAEEVFRSGLPPEPVEVGASWSRTRPTRRDVYGEFGGTIEYTLTKMESGRRRIATVEFEGLLTLTPAPSPPTAGDTRRHDLRRGEYYGVLQYDLDAGEIVAFESTEAVQLDLTLSSPPRRATTGPSSKPARPPPTYTFKIDERRTLRVTASPDAPPRPIVVTPDAPARPPAAHSRAAAGASTTRPSDTIRVLPTTVPVQPVP